MLRCVVVAILFLFVLKVRCLDTVVISAPYGTVTGVERESSYEFLGIPFAEPPVGDLRFESPVTWSAPSGDYQQQATEYGPACTQELYPDFYVFPGTTSEDCLYLNVYTPKSSNIASQNLPVMFWIHGGAFTGGSATENKYNGSVIAATRDVIVVSTNYRLGAFGFLADPALCKEDPSCGMWGIKDQQLALHWVQSNIASFGGNPNNVTIFGESAGGMSVAVHLALESSAGLFHGAIIESGIAEGYPSLMTAKAYGVNVTYSLGCLGVDSEIVQECLQDLDAQSILDAQNICGETNCWWPVVNNFDLSVQPLENIASGEYNQVPVIVGCNGNEGWLFAITMYPPPVTPIEYDEIVLNDFGEFGFLVLDEYPIAKYGSAFNAIEAIIGDFLFVCPAYYIAEAVGYPSVDSLAFMYLFNHTPSWATPRAGAYHGSEVNFVFGYRPEEDNIKFTDEERILSDNMTKWWTNFATTGDPNPSPLGTIPVWPSFQDSTPIRIVLDTGEVEYINEYKKQECDFWRSYYLQYYSLHSHKPPFSLNPMQKTRKL